MHKSGDHLTGIEPLTYTADNQFVYSRLCVEKASSREKLPAGAFCIKVCGFAFVRICTSEIFQECLEPALQWIVSQWRGVSLPLDCCLTSRQTEHIGSGWTETLRWERRGQKGKCDGKMQGHKDGGGNRKAKTHKQLPFWLM